MSASSSATYGPGSWLALASCRLWLLAELDPNHSLVTSCWTAVRDGATAEAILGLLVEEGFRVIPSFAIVWRDTNDGTPTVALRGEASVIVVGADSETNQLTAHGVATWVQRSLDRDVAAVSLTSAGEVASGVALPLGEGVALAGRLDVSLTSDDPVSEGQPKGAPVAVPPSPPPPPPFVSRLKPAVATDPVEVDLGDGGLQADDVDPVEAEVSLTATEPAEGEGDGEAGAPSFDHLFGATQRPPEEAATLDSPSPAKADESEVPVPARQVVNLETLQPADTAYPIHLAVPPPSNADAPTPRPSEPALIESLPWAQKVDLTPSGPALVLPVDSNVSSQAQPPTPALRPQLETDATVNRAALLAAAAEEAAAVAHRGPTVKAVRCAGGHLSPPHASVCRLCGADLPPQAAITAPRPPLGSLRLSTGDVVTLDRGVILGRAPEVSSVTDPDRPHVVKLATTEKDISRTHLEIRLDGWHVLVTDLDSMNGTVVTPPGQEPQRLRANDPVAIEPGTTVTLADEVSFVYEVLR